MKFAPPADGEPVRGGDCDPDAGEAARADADQDGVAPRPSSSSAIIGTSRSLWPRPISSSLRATHRSPSNKAAVQAALDVSNAKSMG